MFVCVTLSLIITMCYVCIPYFTRSRVPSHISVATSVGNKSIGSMWRERFGLYFPNDETPNLVCLFLAFPHFLSCFPIFFSYFFFMVHMFSFLVALIGPSEGPLDFIGTFVRVFRSLCYDGVGPVFNPVHFAAIFEFGFSFKSLENDLRSKSCNTISRKRY